MSAPGFGKGGGRSLMVGHDQEIVYFDGVPHREDSCGHLMRMQLSSAGPTMMYPSPRLYQPPEQNPLHSGEWFEAEAERAAGRANWQFRRLVIGIYLLAMAAWAIWKYL